MSPLNIWQNSLCEICLQVSSSGDNWWYVEPAGKEIEDDRCLNRVSEGRRLVYTDPFIANY